MLGYRSNPVADWEGGRRFPTAEETVRAANRRRIDVRAAFERFHPPVAQLYDPDDLSPWLDGLRGGASNRELASRSGFSEHRIGRWLRGAARPRLPQFLQLVEAITGRVSDWVAALVDIGEVPSLCELHHARQGVRRLVFDEPWAAAILALLGVLQPHPSPNEPIARTLGLSVPVVASVLEAMREAGVVGWTGEGLAVQAPLTVDARPSTEDLVGLRRHWASVSRERLDAPGPEDRFSYNLFNVTRSDMERIRELQVGLYRQIRAIVAESTPPEVCALWVGHLLIWSPEAAPINDAANHHT